ncbi:aldehyde dehydrogenase (NAD+) [Weissella beninensis]|uniref:Aldehyde dehydrogenase n=1 Tax=Periweissella beninensis TaxID=504936 RepID=A0ABT0VIU6_9LACO|nr:aldehyde dehydrogenase [Periweissella beninensis]MBM7544253.1 aldehyde dehydrogenase (NAD+) [Periweissella beninensis]MCM2437757.1 aldehyde dehydrogenase [Periweissella beninensis]
MINEIEQSFIAQQQWFQKHRQLTAQERKRILKKLAKNIMKYTDDLYLAFEHDLGKSKTEVYTTEIGLILNNIRHLLKILPKFVQDKKVPTPLSLLGASSYIKYEPYGTVLIIGPFNYPFQLVFEPLIGAIAAGNTVIVKPSELTPNISQVISNILKSTFIEQQVICIEGGIVITTRLLKLNFDYIFFTGSEQVGKIVMQAASQHLTPLTLELGGKSPVIVTKHADIKLAARKIAWGKFMNAGQTCVAPDYVLIDDTVQSSFIAELKKVINDFYGSDPEQSPDFTRIINDKNWQRLNNLLSSGDILIGGQANKANRYIAPTVMNVNWDSLIMQAEIFGPILPIITFASTQSLEDAVITPLNKKPKPLALYIFSKNKAEQRQVINGISFGGGAINNTIMHMINENLPFGGVGAAGMGSYHGRESLKVFSHAKSILNSSRGIDFKFIYPPYSVNKLKIIQKILHK